MIDPVVIQVSPEKPNLYFSIKENVAGSVTAVISELKHKRLNMERMIISAEDHWTVLICGCNSMHH